MKFLLAAIAAAVLALPPAMADDAASNAAQLALARLKAAGRLTVESPAFGPGGDIPFENTQYRGNMFPGLSWSKGPSATRTYAIIMQDPDASYEGSIILHWTAFNIPASALKLDAGMKMLPEGASDGPNIRGLKQPYLGPHTPPGPKHHYHLQIFALDTLLGPGAGSGLDALIGAMQGHVLASGELVGLAQADPNAPPRK